MATPRRPSVVAAIGASESARWFSCAVADPAANADPTANTKKTAIKFLYKIIGLAVSFYQCFFSFGAGAGHAMLHAEDAFVSLVIDMAEDIVIVHLARTRLFAAGVVADLQIGDVFPGPVEIGDQIAFVAMHVVHVEEILARRAIDGFTDHKGLVGVPEEEIGCIAERLAP